MKNITEYMTIDVISVKEDCTVIDAAKFMGEKEIGAVLVCDKDEKPQGIFTERDLLTKVDLKDAAALEKMLIRDIMTKDLMTVEHTQGYSEAIRIMREKRIRHMPITKDGIIVGMVSLRDMMQQYEVDLELTLKDKETQLLLNIQAIKASEEKFRSIFNNSSVAITFADENELITAWNPLAEKLLGMGLENLFNKPIQELFPDKEWKKIRSMNLREQGGDNYLETIIRNKDGDLIDVDLSISVLKDDKGQVTGSIGIMRDIRQRKEAELNLALTSADLEANARCLHEMVVDKESILKKLKEAQNQIIQAEKMATLGTLAAGFAHEIKNPLAIILQGMERINKVIEKDGNETELKCTEVICNAAQRANKVVTSILRYSRSSQLEMTPIKIHEIIDAAINLLEGNADLGKITINKDIESTDAQVAGDSIMLQQVLFDLFTNSLQAMNKGGELTISTNSEEIKNKRKLIIRIKDTGEGIDPKYINKIFDPFFTTKDEGQGTGLGLSTVYLILERHHGEISVDSQLGQGTEFTISLPQI